MYQIELSIPYAMSLLVKSSAGSDEPDENEEIENEEEEAEDNDVLGMSDEDFEKMTEDDFKVNVDNEDTLGDESDDGEDPEPANEDEPTPTAEDAGSEQTGEDEASEGDQPNETIENPTADDKAYEEAFKLLYGKPIKASGREVQLRNPDHARNFIEMGIDYNKKMQSMKPHLRTLKTLEKEGLLEAGKEERLNLLLEIEKGNKDALKRFIAESDIDPLDLADDEVIEAGRGYRPQNHLVSEQEVEIEEALSAIEGTPSQQRTLDVMTKEFDARSRQVISENPRYIVALNDDIASGVYDDVMEAVQYKKDMRQVPAGMSDMELYIQTVREIASTPIPSDAIPPVAPTNEQTKPNRPSTGSSRRRKVAMSGSKSVKKPKKREYDPMEILSMDDEKFMKEMGMDSL
jgi:hypothetical protein